MYTGTYTEVIETVMTKEYWEKNYLREYRRELRESFVSTCKRILGLIIGTGVFYGAMCIIAIVVETLCNII